MKIVVASHFPERKWGDIIYIIPVVWQNNWRYCIESKEPFAYDDPVLVNEGYGECAKKVLSQPKVIGLNIFGINNPDITLDDITERLKSKNEITQVEYEDREGVDKILEKIELSRNAKSQDTKQKAG